MTVSAVPSSCTDISIPR